MTNLIVIVSVEPLVRNITTSTCYYYSIVHYFNIFTKTYYNTKYKYHKVQSRVYVLCQHWVPVAFSDTQMINS